MAKQEKGPTEEFKVKGHALLTKVREIVHEANVRRIIIEDGEGKTLIEVPLTMVSWASCPGRRRGYRSDRGTGDQLLDPIVHTDVIRVEQKLTEGRDRRPLSRTRGFR